MALFFAVCVTDGSIDCSNEATNHSKEIITLDDLKLFRKNKIEENLSYKFFMSFDIQISIKKCGVVIANR